MFAAGSKRLARITPSWVLLIALTPFPVQALADQPDWHRVHDRDGIQVQTRAVPGSDVNAFRASVEIAAPVDSILAVLGDPAACAHYIHGCAEARVLKSTGFYQRDTYQINDFPWPAQDRDLVLEIRIRELDKGAFRLDMINEPDAFPESQYLRVRQVSGHYLLTPTQPGQTRVDWEQHTDPGGQLPAWLVNQLVTDVPVNTLRALRKLSTSTPYIYQRFSRDENGRILGWHPVDPQSLAMDRW